MKSRCMPRTSILSLSSVADQLFADIEQRSSQEHKLTSEQLSSLFILFDKNLGRALQLVDSRAIKCFTAVQSRRRVFQVQGKTAADQYTVFPTHYCSCQAFFYEVVGRGEAIHCKHQLTARVADALKLCPIIEIPDTTFAQMLIAS